MGSVFSKVSPAGPDSAAGSSEAVALDVTPELREQIKVQQQPLICVCALYNSLTHTSQVVTNFSNGEVSKVLKLYSTHASRSAICPRPQVLPLSQHVIFIQS
jgi:hypothetical protein